MSSAAPEAPASATTPPRARWLRARAAANARCLRARAAANLSLALLALCAAAPAAADWFQDARVGALYDDNLNRAQQPADIRGDAAATLSATAGWFDALTGADAITLTLNANAETYARFHGLNVVSAGASASYRHKFGTGLTIPWMSIGIDYMHDVARDDIRDGNRLDAHLEIGQRFSDNFDASLGVGYDRRNAKDGEVVVPGIPGNVFDLRGQRVFARGAYDITDRLQLGANYAVRRGDVEATTRPNFDIFLASDAIAPDPTFGADFFAYRLRGTTKTATANVSWALSDRSSLNASYADARTRSYDGLEYRTHAGTIVYLYQF